CGDDGRGQGSSGGTALRRSPVAHAPDRRVPPVHQPDDRPALPVRPFVQRLRARRGSPARCAARLVARAAPDSALPSFPPRRTRPGPARHAPRAPVPSRGSWLVNPLNPLFIAVAWVMTQIHAGLSLILPSTSGGAWFLTIVMLVVLMRLIMVPLFVKQMHSMRKMSALTPQLQELRKKYKNDKQTLNEETMRLYRE